MQQDSLLSESVLTKQQQSQMHNNNMMAMAQQQQLHMVSREELQIRFILEYGIGSLYNWNVNESFFGNIP